MKRSALVDAATELNEHLGLDPEINVKAPVPEIKAKVLEACELISDDDEFSDETQAVIDELKGNATTKPADGEAKSDTGAGKKPRGRAEGSLAQFVDELMVKGGTWEEIQKAAAAEAEKRGLKRFRRMGQLKRHAKRRAAAGHNVTMDDERVQMSAK